MPGSPLPTPSRNGSQANAPAADTQLTVTIGTECFTREATLKID